MTDQAQIDAIVVEVDTLRTMLLALTPSASPPPTLPSPDVLAVGKNIKIVELVNIRSSPTGAVIGQAQVDALGTIVAGPTNDPNGVPYWNINFASGPDGWCWGGQPIRMVVVP